jgi:XTP/dITP diphosphohydrolase
VSSQPSPLVPSDDRQSARKRRAKFRCVIALAKPDGTTITAEGFMEGEIAMEPMGESGFGYDPVFVPVEGDGRTFAEMSPAEKHVLSHRGRAFRALAEQLIQER